MPMKRILVALSGGVDSAVAALILRDRGYHVAGAYIRTWMDEAPDVFGECPWLEEMDSARSAAGSIGIPFQIVICALDMRVEEVTSLAGKLHDELEATGIDVLLDDRDARPGFKFKDAELIGIPIRVTIGKRGLADGIVEIQSRKTDDMRKVAPEDAVATVRGLVQTALETDCARKIS